MKHIFLSIIKYSAHFTFITCLGLFLINPEIGITQTKENIVKAVFLERFTRFVQWPESQAIDDTSKPFIIGVTGTNEFSELLDKMYSNQRIKNKPVKVIKIRELSELNDCHILYISEASKININKILLHTSDNAILTISDQYQYALNGVLINFYLQDNKIRFEINESALIKSGLHMSHLLLKEARIVQPRSVR